MENRDFLGLRASIRELLIWLFAAWIILVNLAFYTGLAERWLPQGIRFLRGLLPGLL